METEHENIAVLTVVEGGKGDRLRRETRESSAEDVGGRPRARQRVLGNRPGLDIVVAGAQAESVVGRVKCHRSYFADVGRLYREGLFENLGHQVERHRIKAAAHSYPVFLTPAIEISILCPGVENVMRLFGLTSPNHDQSCAANTGWTGSLDRRHVSDLPKSRALRACGR